MTTLLSKMSLSMLELDMSYNWWVMAPNMHRSVLLRSYLWVLTCITWKLQVMYGRSAYRITALLLEIFFVWFRIEWEIWLENYGPRHISFILCYNIVCIYCKPIHRLLFGVQLQVTTKLTYFMTAYYTPNNGFTTNIASLINIKFTKWYYCTSLWVCCQAAKAGK